MPDPVSASAWRGRRFLVLEDDYLMAEDLRRICRNNLFQSFGY